MQREKRVQKICSFSLKKTKVDNNKVKPQNQ